MTAALFLFGCGAGYVAGVATAYVSFRKWLDRRIAAGDLAVPLDPAALGYCYACGQDAPEVPA